MGSSLHNRKIMTLPLEYSKQESTLKPSDITEEYVRLQVRLRPENNKVIISDTDFNHILQSLAEGRLVGLQSESGVNLGQLQVALAGAYPVSNFKSPTPTDMRIGFKATQQLLKQVREIVTFEQVPMVINNPQIAGFTFIGSVQGVQTKYVNQIPLDTSGVLRISGIHFIKNKMTVSIVQYTATNDKIQSQTLNSALNSGAKYIDILVDNGQLSGSDFDSGELPSPSYTRIIVTQIDNPDRSTLFNFAFLPSSLP